jgi:DNA-binding FadR family transcriptional regulator
VCGREPKEARKAMELHVASVIETLTEFASATVR